MTRSHPAALAAVLLAPFLVTTRPAAAQPKEAEKQLAEFRKRYPDYLIPEAIAEKFERR